MIRRNATGLAVVYMLTLVIVVGCLILSGKSTMPANPLSIVALVLIAAVLVACSRIRS